MSPIIPRAISTQEILLRVSGTDGEPFTTLAVRSTKENGGTTKDTGRLVSDTVLPLRVNTHTHHQIQ